MSEGETPLEAEIKRRIRAEGPIGIDRYMELCLAHPEHGYYMRRDPLGRAGDFITAPEVSQMFGEIVGAWLAQSWEMMGRPSPFLLVELGPGRGTLMADVLRIGRVRPQFAAAARLHLVETSPALKLAQQKTLGSLPVEPGWHERFEDVPPGLALIVANEFFDALSVRQFVRTETGWRERMVGANEKGALGFVHAAHPLNIAVPDWAAAASMGEIIEMSPAREALAQSIGERLRRQRGVALIIDYGHLRSGPGDTLQAVRQHRHADILSHPGECDLTSHVDFEALGKALAAGGTAVARPVTQREFLAVLGLEQRAAVLMRRAGPEAGRRIQDAVKRLAGEDQMGHLFKVMTAAHPALELYPFGSRP